jgi:ribulose 1,5-bisphosphate carboxylase large subunit-like protein
MDQKNIIGYVFHVMKYDTGEVEIDFYDIDNDAILNYSTDISKGGKLSKEIAQTLAETLGCNIWTKLYLNEQDIVKRVGLEVYDFETDNYRLKEKLDKLVKIGS